MNFYDPLPLGSDAFMAPLAPAREERAFDLRQIAIWCVLGTATGAAAGALVLSLVLDRDPEPKDALGKVEVAAVAESADANRESEAKPTRAVAAMPAGGGQPSSDAPQVIPPASAAPAQPPAAQPTAEAKGISAAEASSAPRTASADDDRSAKPRRTARAAEPAIEKPSRAQVIAAMTRVQPAVRACLPGGHGMVTADIAILGLTGRVTSAQISGQIGTVGSCVARAVRQARFPTFRAESMTVRYPMSL